MKKNTLVGIGTFIVNDEIVVAYVDVILNIIKNGATFEDTRNICETLIFLRDNYKGNETVEVLLSQLVSCVHTHFLDNTVVNLDNKGDDTFKYLLGIKTILGNSPIILGLVTLAPEQTK